MTRRKAIVLKAIRIVAFILVFCAVFTIGGCKPKLWSVDFTTVTDLDDWSGDGTYLLNDGGVVGLRLDEDSWVLAPVVFKGNFDLTVVFALLGKSGGNGAFEVGFSGEEEDIHETAAYFELIETASEDVGYGAYEIDWDDDHIYHNLFYDIGPMPSMHFDGSTLNTLLINKVGNHFKVYMNGTLLFDYNQGQYYDSSFYSVWIWGGSFSNVDDWVVFKSIKVEYWGTKIDI